MRTFKGLMLLLMILTSELIGQNYPQGFRNLGKEINSVEDEFLPVVYNDTLYFRRTVANRPSIFYEIFAIACKDIYLQMPSERRLYLINSYENAEVDVTKGNLDPTTPSFFKFDNGKISYMEQPGEFMELNSEYHDFHPAVSPDGSFIVFVSDRPGAIGHTGNPKQDTTTDLYISFRKNDGTWSAPKNLGKTINTKENEISPYIAPDGSLYFSSKGYIRDSVEVVFSGQSKNNRKAKSDVFVRKERLNYNVIKAMPIPGVKGKWQNPVMLPYPLNTEYNEVGATVWRDSLVFLASDRPSNTSVWGRGFDNGRYDLYGYWYQDCPNCPSSNCSKVRLNGNVATQCNRIIPNCNVEIFDKDNKLTAKGLVDEKGEFSILAAYSPNYTVRIYCKCLQPNFYESIVQSSSPCKTDNVEVLPKISFVIPDTCCKGKEQISVSSAKLFDGKSEVLKKESLPELDEIIKKFKNCDNSFIEISSVGQSKSNADVSLKRAKQIVNYLTSNGISKDLIKIISADTIEDNNVEFIIQCKNDGVQYSQKINN